MKVSAYAFLAFGALGLSLGSTTPKQIAIIGGGASGSSAAMYIAQAMQEASIPCQITLYEKNSRLGGRVQSFNVPATNLIVEAGASIFVNINYNLMDAASQFGLNVIDAGIEQSLANPPNAIWNQTGIEYQTTGNEAVDTVGMLERFGAYTLQTVSNFVSEIVTKYMQIYGATTTAFNTINDMLVFMGVQDTTTTTAQAALDTFPDLNQLFLTERVEISTRVNYGQSLAQIHTMGMAISMAAGSSGGLQIQAGNQRIFERMAAASGASISLNTPVASVAKQTTSGGDTQYVVTTKTGKATTFDAVVMASPPNTYHDAAIQWKNLTSGAYLSNPGALSPPVNYYLIHVTFVAGVLRPSYFNRGTPTLNMTVIPLENYSTQGGSTVLPWTSLSHEYVLTTTDTFNICKYNKNSTSVITPSAVFTVTKLFSPQPLSESVLNQMYSIRLWTKTVQHYAYPNLVPRSSSNMPPVTVDSQLYFPNAFEPFISTMETSTVSSRNVANLIVRDFGGSS
ncbi:hypothetical protein IWQ60_005603 [Tieghemiomyces parasiticus]|uniref:Prenylcysteine lyase domain-containing protein n=1 Tax=Tieghemiomyces parasiticus TaxID=78921 RepID=A0A9W8DUG8_9FUNG|nr:hypothetical protein IWQ60_005603 [Tieghemiomyces parasiticus]